MTGRNPARSIDAPARLVAESLDVVPDLVRDALQPGSPREAMAVAAAIAQAALPPEAFDAPPPWLRPGQTRPFRRVLHALRRRGGALLAAPVGTGKTFVALAAAGALEGPGPVDVVAPAVLVAQWRAVAAAVGIEARITSHERVSRGEAPDGEGAVVIDESHRFRNPACRRYQTIAPSLVGRPVLLVSATPVVNRLADLLHQLLLAVRDDALRHLGVASLRHALTAPPVSPGLAHLVIAEIDSGAGRPARHELVVGDWMPDEPRRGGLLAALDRLRLSRNSGVAALIRTTLLRAAASSPAALQASLRRLELLLEHAHAARESGRRVGRRDVERAVGAMADQLVLWGVMDDPEAPADLVLSDRGPTRRLAARVRRSAAGPDRKLSLLRTLLSDRRPTVVFTTATETVHYLRRQLDCGGVAWVTGSRAGIDRSRYSRHLVLRLFDPGSGQPPTRAPWLLIASDVLAEGLNLQRVSRVVHYDLPWTPVRLDQRDGRAIRLGSAHPDVTVIRFDPPPAIEARLALVDRLSRKASLPPAVGLGRGASQAWSWQDRLRDAWGSHQPGAGWAAMESAEPGGAAAVSIDGLVAGPIVLALARSADGSWSDDPALLAAVLEAARGARPALRGREVIDRMLDELAGPVRRRLREASGLACRGGIGTVNRAAVRLAWRKLEAAHRERRLDSVAEADRVLRVVRRGLTAGEERLAALATGGDVAAWSRLARLPGAADPVGPPRIRLVGALALVPSFGPGLQRLDPGD